MDSHPGQKLVASALRQEEKCYWAESRLDDYQTSPDPAPWHKPHPRRGCGFFLSPQTSSSRRASSTLMIPAPTSVARRFGRRSPTATRQSESRQRQYKHRQQRNKPTEIISSHHVTRTHRKSCRFSRSARAPDAHPLPQSVLPQKSRSFRRDKTIPSQFMERATVRDSQTP